MAFGWEQGPRIVQEAQMPGNRKDESKELPGGRALDRLRQFEDARRPADVTPSPDQSDTAAPREPAGKRKGATGGNDDARKDR
jgi:hypothetical protein